MPGPPSCPPGQRLVTTLVGGTVVTYCSPDPNYKPPAPKDKGKGTGKGKRDPAPTPEKSSKPPIEIGGNAQQVNANARLEAERAAAAAAVAARAAAAAKAAKARAKILAASAKVQAEFKLQSDARESSRQVLLANDSRLQANLDAARARGDRNAMKATRALLDANRANIGVLEADELRDRGRVSRTSGFSQLAADNAIRFALRNEADERQRGIVPSDDPLKRFEEVRKHYGGTNPLVPLSTVETAAGNKKPGQGGYGRKLETALAKEVQWQADHPEDISYEDLSDFGDSLGSHGDSIITQKTSLDTRLGKLATIANNKSLSRERRNKAIDDFHALQRENRWLYKEMKFMFGTPPERSSSDKLLKKGKEGSFVRSYQQFQFVSDAQEKYQAELEAQTGLPRFLQRTSPELLSPVIASAQRSLHNVYDSSTGKVRLQTQLERLTEMFHNGEAEEAVRANIERGGEIGFDIEAHRVATLSVPSLSNFFSVLDENKITEGKQLDGELHRYELEGYIDEAVKRTFVAWEASVAGREEYEANKPSVLDARLWDYANYSTRPATVDDGGLGGWGSLVEPTFDVPGVGAVGPGEWLPKYGRVPDWDLMNNPGQAEVFALAADSKYLSDIKQRYEDEIRKELGIEDGGFFQDLQRTEIGVTAASLAVVPSMIGLTARGVAGGNIGLNVVGLPTFVDAGEGGFVLSDGVKVGLQKSVISGDLLVPHNDGTGRYVEPKNLGINFDNEWLEFLVGAAIGPAVTTVLDTETGESVTRFTVPFIDQSPVAVELTFRTSDAIKKEIQTELFSVADDLRELQDEEDLGKRLGASVSLMTAHGELFVEGNAAGIANFALEMALDPTNFFPALVFTKRTLAGAKYGLRAGKGAKGADRLNKSIDGFKEGFRINPRQADETAGFIEENLKIMNHPEFGQADVMVLWNQALGGITLPKDSSKHVEFIVELLRSRGAFDQLGVDPILLRNMVSKNLKFILKSRTNLFSGDVEKAAAIVGIALKEGNPKTALRAKLLARSERLAKAAEQGDIAARAEKQLERAAEDAAAASAKAKEEAGRAASKARKPARLSAHYQGARQMLQGRTGVVQGLDEQRLVHLRQMEAEGWHTTLTGVKGGDIPVAIADEVERRLAKAGSKAKPKAKPKTTLDPEAVAFQKKAARKVELDKTNDAVRKAARSEREKLARAKKKPVTQHADDVAYHQGIIARIDEELLSTNPRMNRGPRLEKIKRAEAQIAKTIAIVREAHGVNLREFMTREVKAGAPDPLAVRGAPRQAATPLRLINRPKEFKHPGKLKPIAKTEKELYHASFGDNPTGGAQRLTGEAELTFRTRSEVGWKTDADSAGWDGRQHIDGIDFMPGSVAKESEAGVAARTLLEQGTDAQNAAAFIELQNLAKQEMFRIIRQQPQNQPMFLERALLGVHNVVSRARALRETVTIRHAIVAGRGSRTTGKIELPRGLLRSYGDEASDKIIEGFPAELRTYIASDAVHDFYAAFQPHDPLYNSLGLPNESDLGEMLISARRGPETRAILAKDVPWALGVVRDDALRLASQTAVQKLHQLPPYHGVQFFKLRNQFGYDLFHSLLMDAENAGGDLATLARIHDEVFEVAFDASKGTLVDDDVLVNWLLMEARAGMPFALPNDVIEKIAMDLMLKNDVLPHVGLRMFHPSYAANRIPRHVRIEPSISGLFTGSKPKDGTVWFAEPAASWTRPTNTTAFWNKPMDAHYAGKSAGNLPEMTRYITAFIGGVVSLYGDWFGLLKAGAPRASVLEHGLRAFGSRTIKNGDFVSKAAEQEVRTLHQLYLDAKGIADGWTVDDAGLKMTNDAGDVVELGSQGIVDMNQFKKILEEGGDIGQQVGYHVRSTFEAAMRGGLVTPSNPFDATIFYLLDRQFHGGGAISRTNRYLKHMADFGMGEDALDMVRNLHAGFVNNFRFEVAAVGIGTDGPQRVDELMRTPKGQLALKLSGQNPKQMKIAAKKQVIDPQSGDEAILDMRQAQVDQQAELAAILDVHDVYHGEPLFKSFDDTTYNHLTVIDDTEALDYALMRYAGESSLLTENQLAVLKKHDRAVNIVVNDVSNALVSSRMATDEWNQWRALALKMTEHPAYVNTDIHIAYQRSIDGMAYPKARGGIGSTGVDRAVDNSIRRTQDAREAHLGHGSKGRRGSRTSEIPLPEDTKFRPPVASSPKVEAATKRIGEIDAKLPELDKVIEQSSHRARAALGKGKKNLAERVRLAAVERDRVLERADLISERKDLVAERKYAEERLAEAPVAPHIPGQRRMSPLQQAAYDREAAAQAAKAAPQPAAPATPRGKFVPNDEGSYKGAELQHFTTEDSARAIRSEGFIAGKKKSPYDFGGDGPGTRHALGDGIYFRTGGDYWNAAGKEGEKLLTPVEMTLADDVSIKVIQSMDELEALAESLGIKVPYYADGLPEFVAALRKAHPDLDGLSIVDIDNWGRSYRGSRRVDKLVRGTGGDQLVVWNKSKVKVSEPAAPVAPVAGAQKAADDALEAQIHALDDKIDVQSRIRHKARDDWQAIDKAEQAALDAEFLGRSSGEKGQAALSRMGKNPETARLRKLFKDAGVERDRLIAEKKKIDKPNLESVDPLAGDGPEGVLFDEGDSVAPDAPVARVAEKQPAGPRVQTAEAQAAKRVEIQKSSDTATKLKAESETAFAESQRLTREIDELTAQIDAAKGGGADTYDSLIARIEKGDMRPVNDPVTGEPVTGLTAAHVKRELIRRRDASRAGAPPAKPKLVKETTTKSPAKLQQDGETWYYLEASAEEQQISKIVNGRAIANTDTVKITLIDDSHGVAAPIGAWQELRFHGRIALNDKSLVSASIVKSIDHNGVRIWERGATQAATPPVSPAPLIAKRKALDAQREVLVNKAAYLKTEADKEAARLAKLNLEGEQLNVAEGVGGRSDEFARMLAEMEAGDPPPVVEVPIPPDPAVVAHTRAAVAAHEAGISETEWLRRLQKQNRERINRKGTSPAERAELMASNRNISRALRNIRKEKYGGTYKAPPMRFDAADRAAKSVADEVSGVIPDRQTSYYALTDAAASTEMARSVHAMLKGHPITPGGMPGLRKLNPAHWETITDRVREAIRLVQEQRTSSIGLRRLHDEVLEESDAILTTRRDASPLINRVKQKALADVQKELGIPLAQHISLDEYDRIRTILQPHVGRKNRALDILVEARRSGGDLRETFLKIRRLRADENAVNNVRWTLLENPGMTVDEAVAHLKAGWYNDGTIKYEPVGMFQADADVLRSFFEYTTGASMDDADSVIEALAANGTLPPMGNKHWFRTFMTENGFWSPRARELAVEKGTWPIEAETRWWIDNYGQAPRWLTDTRILDGSAMLDHFTYMAVMKETGNYDEAARLARQLGDDQTLTLQDLVHGNPEKNLDPPKTWAEERQYMIQRYGKLVSDDGVTLTSAPWLMTEDEIAKYIAKNNIIGSIPGVIDNLDDLEKIQQAAESIAAKYAGVYIKLADSTGPIVIDPATITEMAYEGVREMAITTPWRGPLETVVREGKVGLLRRGLNAWSSLWTLSVISHPAFTLLNATDIPIRGTWFGVTDHYAKIGFRISENTRKRVTSIGSLGLGEHTAFSSGFPTRSALERMRTPYNKKDAWAGLLDLVTSALPRTILPRVENATKFRLGQQLYEGMYQVHHAELLALGHTEDIIDVMLKLQVQKRLNKWFPTLATAGPAEKLLNKVFPFVSYYAKNQIIWIGEMLDHPWALNTINKWNAQLTEHNMEQWDREHPEMAGRMPEHLRSQIPMGFQDDDGAPVFLDIGTFVDATRGMQILTNASKRNTVSDLFSAVFRPLPAQIAGLKSLAYFSYGGFGRKKFVKILDENGLWDGKPTSYTEITVPPGTPWGDEGFDFFRDIIWAVDFVDTLLDSDHGFGNQTLTVANMLMWGAMARPSQYFMLNQQYFNLHAGDEEIGKRTGEEGTAARSWLKTKDGERLRKMWAESENKPLGLKLNPFALAYGDDDHIPTPKDIRKRWLAQQPPEIRQEMIDAWESSNIMGKMWDDYMHTIPWDDKEALREAWVHRETFFNGFNALHPGLSYYQGMGMSQSEFNEWRGDYIRDREVDDFFKLFNYDDKPDDKIGAAEWEMNRKSYLEAHEEVAAFLLKSKTDFDRSSDLVMKAWDVAHKGIKQAEILRNAAYAADNLKGVKSANMLIKGFGMSFDAEAFGNDAAPGKPARFNLRPDALGLALRKAAGDPQAIREAHYGDRMAGAIRESTDKKGQVDGLKFHRILDKNPDLLEQYLLKHPEKRADWERNGEYLAMWDRFGRLADKGLWDQAWQVYDNAPQRIRDYMHDKFPKKFAAWERDSKYNMYMGKWIGMFDTVGSKAAMAYFNGLPGWAKEKYYANHPGFGLNSGTGSAYVSMLNGMFDLIDAGNWDAAEKVWMSAPSWMRSRYYGDNPSSTLFRGGKGGSFSGSGGSGGGISDAKFKQYIRLMKKWVGFYKNGEDKKAEAYFRTLPSWAQDFYIRQHPDKAMLKDSIAMQTLVASFMLADKAHQQQMLEDSPKLARWLNDNDAKAAWVNAINFAYTTLTDPWQKRVFREKYPEIFSKEAQGKAKIDAVMATLAEHPEFQAPWLRWYKHIAASLLEAQKWAVLRPAGLTSEHEYERRGRHHGLSADEVGDKVKDYIDRQPALNKRLPALDA